MHAKGFTLIELMIVIAIIGILAAVAIPQYRDFITRTEVENSLHAARSVQLVINEFSSRHSRLPADKDELANHSGIATTAVSHAAGNVASIDIRDDGEYQITMVNTAEISQVIRNKTFLVQPQFNATTGISTYEYVAGGDNPMDVKYLPRK